MKFRRGKKAGYEMTRQEEKIRFWNGPTERITGDETTPEKSLFRHIESGVYFRIHHIHTGRGREPVEIDQITDVHFNYCNEHDLQNEELADTVQCRKWLANADSVKGIRNVLTMARYADQIVVTGDTLDYLSEGAMELTKSEIWDRFPETLICLGGHELTREMQTGKPDRESLEDRLTVLKAFWQHDMFYTSRLLEDKVLVCALDNSMGRYLPYTAQKLAEDVKRARENGWTMLLFQHEPIDTGKPEDENCPTLWECDGKSYNFRKCIGSAARNTDEPTAAVLSLIRENGDLIRGIYCGHLHSAYYTEIPAFFTENGEQKETVIPQYVLEGNPYNGQSGHVLRILVD